jgi:tetratricopeptide (TPR) repeat protein
MVAVPSFKNVNPAKPVLYLSIFSSFFIVILSHIIWSASGAITGTDAPSKTATDILHLSLKNMKYDPDTESLLVDIAFAFARAGHIDEGLRVAKSIQGDHAQEMAFSKIAICQARSRNIPDAIRVAGMIRDNKHHAIAWIAVQQAQNGDSQDSIRLIREELGVGPSADYVLRLLAHNEERAGKFAEASAIYRSLSGPLDTIRAERATCRAKLALGDEAGAISSATRTKDLLGELINNNPSFAKSILAGIRENYYSDSLFMDIALKQANNRESTEATRSAERIVEDAIRSTTYSRMTLILERLGDTDAARAMISRALGIASRSNYPGFAWCEIGAAQFSLGEKHTSARDSFFKAYQTAGSSDNQAMVVYYQARAGDIQGAIETARLITDGESRARLSKFIAGFQAEHGDLAAAYNTAGAIADTRSRAEAYQRIAAIQAKSGDRSAATQTLRKIDHFVHSLEADTVRSIARDWVTYDDVNSAMEWALDQQIPERCRARALLGVAEGMLPELELPSMRLESP